MNGNRQQHKRTTAGRLIALAAIFASLALLTGANRPADEAKLIRQKVCATYQADYERIVAAGKGNADIAAFQKRLERLDSVAGSILSDLAIHQTAYISRTVATVGKGPDKPTGKPAGALKLLTDNQEGFAAPLPLASVNETDRKALEAYYQTAIAAVTDSVFAKAQKLLRAEEAAEAQRLALILPLLTCPDERWSQGQMEDLPTWLKRPDALRVAEDLALHAQRPRTAYALSLAVKGPTTAPSDTAYVDYLEKSADLMLRGKDYPAGLLLLRSALQSAKDAKLTQRRADLRFRLVEVIHDTASPKEAAEDLAQFLREAPDDNSYGKAAMLRLKYMYEAGEAKQVLSEADNYQKDPRCQPYLAQVFYIAWVASRRDTASSDAGAPWRQAFLERFPDHPLGADMYFASAMSALARGNYNEAGRILQFIEYRYPGSKLIPKVKEIEQRLNTAAGAATRPNG